jgi:GT2 family glycosyltransferase
VTPELSVVVVVGPLRGRAAPCLASLAAQGLGERLEVLLVDLGPEGAAPVPGAGSPQVRVLKLPKETTFAAARARGAAEANAPVVAFLEEHTTVRPGWAGAVLAAHGDPGVSGVGWGIVGANPGVGKADVVGLLSYGLFEPPVPEGDTRLLPGHNASFRRDVLRSYGEELPRLLACDLVFHERMLREGHRFVLAKGAVMEHLNETSYSSIALGIELFYRIYAPLRAKEGRWGPGRRALYVLATPVIPIYSLFLAVRRHRKTHPGHARLLLRNAPFVYAVQLRAAWGQALGLLFGPGDAEARMTAYELSEPREAPKRASA